MAIGAPYSDYNGSNAGLVSVYENYSGIFSQIGQYVVGENSGDFSGWSVSLSSDGNTLAVGAKFNDNSNGTNAGHVRVYEYISGLWSKIGQDLDGDASNDNNGTAVSLSGDGNTVVVGAPRSLNQRGYVRLYTKISDPNFGTWTWSQTGQDILGENSNDRCGRSVSLSEDGNTVAVGSPWHENKRGHVRLFTKISDPTFGTWTWSQIGQDIDGEAADDENGHSVSLSSDGNTIAIGSPESQKVLSGLNYNGQVLF